MAVRHITARLARATCAPVPARPGLILLGTCEYLVGDSADAAEDLASPYPRAVIPASTTTPAATQVTDPVLATPSAPAPVNESLIVPVQSGGLSVLMAQNTSDTDAHVTIAASSAVVAATYVRQESSARIDGIEDGTYDIYVVTGTDWNTPKRRFDAAPSARRFEPQFALRTTRRSATRWHISVEPIPAGDARTEAISPEEVPR